MVSSTILYAAIMIFWFLALSGFQIISSVSVVNVMSHGLPGPACLLILGSFVAIIIALCSQ